MGNIDVAIILLDQDILTDLISGVNLLVNGSLDASYRIIPVDEDIVELKFKHKIDESLLDLPTTVRLLLLCTSTENRT